MKNLFYNLIHFLTLTSIILVNSCSKGEFELKGQITNSVNDSINIYANGIDKKIILNNNKFKTTISFPEGIYNLRHGDEITTIFLSPGNDIEINIDANKFDELIEFSGPLSNENYFLKKKSLHNKTNREKFTDLFSKNEKDFLKNIKKIINDRINLIEDFEDKNGKLNKEFKSYELQDLDYRYKYYVINYKSAFSYYTKKEPIISDSFLNITNDIDYLNNDLFKNSTYYKSIVLSHFFESNNISKGKYDNFNKLIESKSDAIKEQVALQGKYYISSEIVDIKKFVDILTSLSNNQETINELLEIYQNTITIMPGNKSPEFVNYENHSGGYNSLSDYIGKYVYIDVWATWCGPCIREIPFFEEVQKEFQNKNIEFISISIDDRNRPLYNYDKWMEYVKDEKLSGIHLFADNAWNSEFIKSYNINSIPRYLLIDNKGFIISADASRPSDKSLINQINSLKHINCNEENCVI